MDDTRKVDIPASDNDLLKECDVHTFRSSGKGGQHVNKTESGVRLVHRPSGTTVLCRRERSQYLNRRECLGRLRQKLEKMNVRQKKRIPTRVPKSAMVKRKEQKTSIARKKNLRKKILPEE